MKINAEEISALIKKEIGGFETRVDEEEVGTVLNVGDGIAKVHGLRNIMSSEMVVFENGSEGLALNLEEDAVGIVILGDYLEVKEGFIVKRQKKLLSIPVGDSLLGRVVSPIGNPIDGAGSIDASDKRFIEIIAPGIAKRQPVKVPLQTGVKAIDSMIPIGRGQRELIIGDRQTGKTTIAIDTIINQKDTGVICVYVAIGQRASTVAAVVEKLREHGAMDHTIVVSTHASDPAPMLYLAPYAGCTIAEHFMYSQGKDTLVIYDDLSKHANAYRQLSLLLERPPGREAYPGDVFYLHSRLLERSVKLSDEMKAGSLTALPIIETQEGEVSAYIPTNVISITDGQIYLTPKLFASGLRPAIDVGISVSRVGGNAQIKGMKSVAGSLRLDMAQYRSLEAFAQLGTELDKATQGQLDRGARLVEVLKQKQNEPLAVELQIVIIYAGTKGFLDTIPVDKVRDFESGLFNFLKSGHSKLLAGIKKAKVIKDEDALGKALNEYVDIFKQEKGIE